MFVVLFGVSQLHPERKQAFRERISEMTGKRSKKIKGNFSGIQLKTPQQLQAGVQSSPQRILHCACFQLVFLVSAKRPPQVEAGLQTWETTEATDT